MKNKRVWLVGTISVIVFVIIIGVCFLSGRNTKSTGMKIEKNTIEWNQDMQSADENADIQIPYYADIYMENGADTIDMVLVNPKENECYFAYTFILSETGKEIYHSDLIEPGRAIEEVRLNQKMGTGVYQLDIRIDTYSLEGTNALNNAVIPTSLTVS